VDLLLVEDNPGDLLLLQLVFEKIKDIKLKIEPTTRLSESLEKLSKKDFDIALLDLNLPDSKGTDSFTAINKKEPDLPIIIISGAENDIYAKKAVKMGAYRNLVKGKITSQQLINSIKSAIKNKRHS
jgi:two-component system, LuxR family, sensor histidine kinase DctS